MWADQSSNPGEDPPPQNIEEIKEQIDQQQTMIEQLKDTLRKNEEQRATKEKAAEEYASKLSGIKSRSKGLKRSSRGGSSSKRSEEEPAVKKEEEEKIRQGNLNLLRKKLEENRAKFEQRSSVDSKQIEEKVEQLRLQLEERDHKIQELQRGLEAAPLRTTPRVTPAQPQVGEEENGKVAELSARVLQLEARVLDLQENLKEKDEVIDARTRAIALMSEEKDKKRKWAQDNLDDTREQMRLMQHNFVGLEAEMKQEKEELLKQLDAKDRRLHHLEEGNQKLESVRYELSTRIAELQSKVVNLQTQNSELQKVHVGGADGSRVQELLKQLDDANKLMIKNKAQHKNKVKQLTKQLDNLKKVSDSSGEIVRLQQRVAELEEEKGNLQLHLVDFDELKAADESWRHRVGELEDKVKLQSRDLDSHLHALSLLEAEKLDLMQGLQDERLHTSSLVAELERLRANITELENLKVTAEMKAVELEEQVDILSREKSELQGETLELKLQLERITTENCQLEERSLVALQRRDSLEKQVAALQQELSAMEASSLLEEADSNRSFQMLSSVAGEEEKWKRVSMADEAPAEKHVKDSSNHELSLKLLEAEVDELHKTIAQQNDIIAELKSKLESREEDLEMQQEIISKLEQIGQEVVHDEDANKISEIVKELNEMAGDLEEWKTRCTEVEDRLKGLENEKSILEKKLEEVTSENSDLCAQLRLQKQVSEEAVSKLNEQAKLLTEQRESIMEVEKLVEERQKIIDQQSQALLWKESELSELSTELQKFKDKQTHEQDSSTSEAQLQQSYKDMEAVIKLKEAEITKVIQSLEEKTVQTDKFSREVAERNSAFENMSREYQDQLKRSAESCSRMTETLNQKQLEVQELTFDLEMTRSALQTKNEELVTVKQKLEVKLSELVGKDEALQKCEQTIREQAEKMKRLAANLKAKAIAARGHEEQESKLASLLEEKERVILELTERNKNELNALRTELDEKAKALEAISDKYTVLETSLRSEEAKNEGLAEHVRQLSELNSALQSEKSLLEEEKESASRLAKEHEATLRSQVTELEREISILQMDREEGKNKEELKRLLAEKELELGMMERVIVSKDMQLSALQDQLSGISERFQQSWSALEAKLQEREAFVESLEQDLVRSREHERHLEEGLSNLEERRRSLETKYEALGMRLEESDRIKEEVEEHEDLLEQRLTSLMTSEENLRRKLDSLCESNSELTLKISVLTAEKEDLLQGRAESENALRNASKEMERQLPFEAAYNQALERIQQVEAEFRRSSAEFERTLKDSSQKSQQLIESLEMDLKSMSSQVQLLEEEKHALMEHCEKLNDSKCSLEEEMEDLNEVNSELKNTLSEKQREIEILTKERDQSGGSSPQGTDVELDKKVAELSVQVTDLKSTLAQRDSELQDYQSRLLKLYFGGSELEIAPVEKCLEQPRQYSSSPQKIEESVPPRVASPPSPKAEEYESRLSSLMAEKEELWKELLREKAKSEINNIISLAVDQVSERKSMKATSSRTVCFEGDERVDRESRGSQECEEKSLLDEVKEERDAAFARIEELTLEYDRSQELETVMRELKLERDALKLRIGQLSSEQICLQELESQVRELNSELDLVKSERDTLIIRVHELSADLAQLQSVSGIESFGQAPPEYLCSIPSEAICGRGMTPLTNVNFGSSPWEGEADDGWGWGSDDARLEEEHLQKQQQEAAQIVLEPSNELRLLQTKVNDLQEEREKLLEDLRIAQVRSGKLLTKLKDFKIKNEKLMRENQSLASKKNDFSDLDSAIEQELKIRIDSLEKELKDCTNERDVARTEKESLVKRVDTLTAANERFVEMKERQDIDVEMYQRKNKELANLVETLQWKLGHSEAGSWDDSANTDELQERLMALAADNEQLQNILEEQRNLRLAAEATIKELENKVASNDLQADEIINTLRSEIQSLSEKYECAVRELEQRASPEEQANLMEQEEGILDALREENSNLREKCENLLLDLECKAGEQANVEEGVVDVLRAECTTLRERNETLYREVEHLRASKGASDTLQANYEYLQFAHERLGLEMSALKESYCTLESDYEKVQSELQTVDAIKRQIDDLERAKLSAEEEYQTLVEQHMALKRELQEIRNSYGALKSQHAVLEKQSVQENFVQTEQVFEPPRLCDKQTGTEPIETSSVSTMTEEDYEEKHKIIGELRDELKKKTAEMDVLRDMISTEQQERADTENELNYMISSLQSELERSQKNEEDKEQEISKLASQLASNREEMEVQKNESWLQKVSSKEEEIQSLQLRLIESEQEAQRVLANKDEDIEELKSQISERERQFDESMFVKDEDIQNLRIQYSELERRTQENLGLKDQDIYNLQLLLTEKDKKIYQLSQMLEDEAKQVTELQDQLDKREAINSGLQSSESPKEPRDELQELADGQSNQQSELDLALYMLHQRDVRCDELTLELMQLLEERDTLQLRLSSALKINEELRTKANRATSITSSPVRVPVTLLSSLSSESSRADDQVLMPIDPQPITEESQEHLAELSTKLSQLHRIDYRRDVTVQDESQQRHGEQMQLLQHRGAGIVVESNYTLSRDVQSPSTVLLNWIWGRSTPRVMHI